MIRNYVEAEPATAAKGVNQKMYDVIVVGLGPVGAICAHLLAARGISALVIEKANTIYDLPRAIHIDHEVMRILQSVGLAEQLLPTLSMAVGGVHFGADLAITRPFQRYETSERLGWSSDYFFYQPDFETVLREQLCLRDNVDIRLGREVTAVRQCGDVVSVVLDGTEEISASYVFGCDGARSIVRKSTGTELEDLGFEESWIVVDAVVDGPIQIPDLRGLPAGIDLQRLVFLIGDPTRPTSVIPGPGSHRRWEFLLLPSEVPDDYADNESARKLLAPWLGEQRYSVVRCTVYRFHALLAKKWMINRVFLLGDAAHQTPPFFGQGLCHGIRDAANLTWKLRMVLDGVSSANLLSTYQLERLPHVRKIIETSIQMGRFMCTLDAETARARDAIMREQIQGATQAKIDIIPKLEGGITAPRQRADSPVGERFIQPPMIDHRGQRRLLDDFTRRGFVLLSTFLVNMSPAVFLSGQVKLDCFTIRSSDTVLPERERELHDCSGELVGWLENHHCRGVVLRPDGYVYGIFSSPEEATAVLEDLELQLSNIGTFERRRDETPIVLHAEIGEAMAPL